MSPTPPPESRVRSLRILLDLFMPVVDGWAFRRNPLHDPQLAAIPVVVLTGACETIRSALELQPAAFFTKPFSVPALLETVAAHGR